MDSDRDLDRFRDRLTDRFVDKLMDRLIDFLKCRRRKMKCWANKMNELLNKF